MKKSLLLLTGIVLTVFNSFAQWVPQYSGTNKFINSVYFVNTDTGYASADGGRLLKTADGGETWNSNQTSTSQDFLGICFTSDETGYVITSGGSILKTTNGGTTWTLLSSGATNALLNEYFIGNTGYVAGDGTTIIKTTDAGQTWTSMINGAPDGNYKAVYFINVDTGFASRAEQQPSFSGCFSPVK